MSAPDAPTLNLYKNNCHIRQSFFNGAHVDHHHRCARFGKFGMKMFIA